MAQGVRPLKKLLLAVLLLELALRLTYSRRRSVLPKTIKYDRELGYVLKPDFAGHSPYPGCPDVGYRGAPLQKADIALVADSIVYGVEVPDRSTLAAHLERLSGLKVANLAVTGYGTTQQRLLFERCGRSLSPRLVVTVPYFNDPLDNAQFETWRSSAAAQGLPFAKWCMTLGVPWPSARCDALTALNRLALGDALVHTLARRVKLETMPRSGLEAMCAGLRGQAAVLPAQWRRYPEALAELKACLKVPTLELPELPLGRVHKHWTADGHLAAAEHLWRFLLREGLVEPPPARAPSGVAPKGRFVSVCDRRDPILGHAYAPGCAGWRVWNGRPVWMSYNALGLRDKDYGPRRGLRLLVVGGSVVAGSGLEEQDSPPRAFERALRRRGLAAEVINGAGEGWTGRQSTLALPAALEAYRPDAVVYYLPSHHVFADYAGDSRVLASWRLRGFDDLVGPTLENLRSMREKSPRLLVAFAPEPLDSQRRVIHRKAPFWERRLVKPFRYDGALLEKRLRDQGFEVLTLPVVERRLDGDYHWDAEGSAAFGEALAERFVSAWRRRAPSPTAR